MPQQNIKNVYDKMENWISNVLKQNGEPINSIL